MKLCGILASSFGRALIGCAKAAITYSAQWVQSLLRGTDIRIILQYSMSRKTYSLATSICRLKQLGSPASTLYSNLI